jgi:hypothetical protein
VVKNPTLMALSQADDGTGLPHAWCRYCTISLCLCNSCMLLAAWWVWGTVVRGTLMFFVVWLEVDGPQACCVAALAFDNDVIVAVKDVDVTRTRRCFHQFCNNKTEQFTDCRSMFSYLEGPSSVAPSAAKHERTWLWVSIQFDSKSTSRNSTMTLESICPRKPPCIINNMTKREHSTKFMQRRKRRRRNVQ